jgi:hypothetical protein
VTCKTEFHPEKNGVVLEIYGALWHADLWKCPICGTEIIAGYGFKPLAEEWQPKYDAFKNQTERLYTAATDPVGATA